MMTFFSVGICMTYPGDDTHYSLEETKIYPLYRRRKVLAFFLVVFIEVWVCSTSECQELGQVLQSFMNELIWSSLDMIMMHNVSCILGTNKTRLNHLRFALFSSPALS